MPELEIEEVETNTTRTIKSNPYPNRTTKGVHNRKAPKNFEWNDLNIKAYKDIDIEVPEHIAGQRRDFLLK
jgi:hypothetical protein